MDEDTFVISVLTREGDNGDLIESAFDALVEVLQEYSIQAVTVGTEEGVRALRDHASVQVQYEQQSRMN